MPTLVASADFILAAKRALRYLFDVARKIRQLIADLQTAGFQLTAGGKGSHRKFRHARFPGSVILSGKDGDDALPYKRNKCATLFAKRADENGRSISKIRSLERGR